MNLGTWLKDNTQKLHTAGISTARLDCLVLLEDTLHKDRAFLLAHPEIILTSQQQTKLDKQIASRAQHAPLAYIRGKSEFYGREFVINKHVLEPRPESETMIDQLKTLPTPKYIIDVGTGSGALAITAKLELPQTDVLAIDIDPNCLEIARQNIAKHRVNISMIQSDFLQHVKLPQGAVLICNLPYVPDKFMLNQAAMNEPKIAIFGGQDGLDHYRTLFEQISNSKNKPTYVLTESLPFQHTDLTKIAQAANYQQLTEEDFIQVFNPTSFGSSAKPRE